MNCGDKMKIGIYLGYAPTKNMSIKQEGLGRYLAYIMKGLIESNNDVVLACPKWIIPAIEELCEEHNIDDSKFSVLTSNRSSVVFNIFWKWLNSDKKTRKKTKFKYILVSLLNVCVDYVINITSSLLFILLFALIALVCLIALPFVLAIGILMYVLSWVTHFLHLDKIGHFLYPKHMVSYVFTHSKICKYLYNKYYINRELLIRVRERAADDIINKISKMKDKADIWYSPMAFWPEFNKIPGRRVVCAPDIVTSEFAINFSTRNYGDSSIQTEEVRKTLLGGEYFITYCDFIKNSLLVNQLYKKEENIVSIPHGVNDMSSTISVNPTCYSRLYGVETEDILARNILSTITTNVLDQEEYMGEGGRSFSFRNVEYIFYASQVRGNKNFLTLLKAYEYLLKKKKITEKLFLTGILSNDPEIMDYIRTHGLEHDVLSFTRVSNQQLGALYKCAKLAVNPTLYEGGFNFTFGESMSVGTPSIMGNIPQVLEVVHKYGIDKFFFDPFDYIDMANKIEYGLKHTQEIYIIEKKLFDDMCARSWSDVGREYVSAFMYFIEKGESKENV